MQNLLEAFSLPSRINSPASQFCAWVRSILLSAYLSSWYYTEHSSVLYLQQRKNSDEVALIRLIGLNTNLITTTWVNVLNKTQLWHSQGKNMFLVIRCCLSYSQNTWVWESLDERACGSFMILYNPLTKVLIPIPMTFTSDSLEVLVLTWVMVPLMYTTMVLFNWKMIWTPSHLVIRMLVNQYIKKGVTLLVIMIDFGYPGEIGLLLYKKVRNTMSRDPALRTPLSIFTHNSKD